MAAAKRVGVFFNESDVLEHTWTTATIPQITLALGKLKWLARPADVPRYLPRSTNTTDSRAFPTYLVVDGTNVAEMAFGEIEKPISSHGGYKEKIWQGKLLNKIGRMNERERVAQAGGPGPGHYHLQRARLHNALMSAHSLALPHPSLPDLAPRARVLQGVDAFYAELARRRLASAPGASSSSAAGSQPQPTAAASAATFMQPTIAAAPEKPKAPKRKSSEMMAADAPAASADCAGSRVGHKTFGWGWQRQVSMDLEHGKLCATSCPAYGSKKVQA